MSSQRLMLQIGRVATVQFTKYYVDKLRCRRWWFEKQCHDTRKLEYKKPIKQQHRIRNYEWTQHAPHPRGVQDAYHKHSLQREGRRKKPRMVCSESMPQSTVWNAHARHGTVRRSPHEATAAATRFNQSTPKFRIRLLLPVPTINENEGNYLLIGEVVVIRFYRSEFKF